EAMTYGILFTRAFGNIGESYRTLSTTKKPTSVMSLAFVASNGKAGSLILFPTDYRLVGPEYIKV
ncbi:Hypothetical protein FKW44_012928, partial [Caligus rogercresseyi]